jgi:hypothetical protein
MKLNVRIPLVLLAAVSLACAGHAYLPGELGGAKSDLRGLDVREAWAEEHVEEDADIRQAVVEGVFIPGMTVEHRDLISNPKRKGATGNGYWRSRITGDETRYQWFVSGQWEPFHDGRERLVCELVYVDEHLTEVRYCSAAAETTQSGTS